ncbi:MAG: hypothetical protein WBC44_01760, partial [Planctomycetaceae bacterium]
SAWPASLNFGALAVGETGEEYVVLASHRGHGFAIERIESPAGMTVQPAKEQLADGSRTFVIQQKATASGNQKDEILFHVRRGESSEADRERVTIRLALSYYGTEASTEKLSATIMAPAASSESGEAEH